MPKYRVSLIREVSDLTRYMVDVEAESANAAVEKVKAMDNSEWEFSWWQCCDNNTPDEYEPRELDPGEDFHPEGVE